MTASRTLKPHSTRFDLPRAWTPDGTPQGTAMTPDQARQLLVQANCDGNTDHDYLDALRTIACITPEYDAIEQSPCDGSITGGGAFRTLEEAAAWAAQAPYRTARVRYVSRWKPLGDPQ